MPPIRYKDAFGVPRVSGGSATPLVKQYKPPIVQGATGRGGALAPKPLHPAVAAAAAAAQGLPTVTKAGGKKSGTKGTTGQTIAANQGTQQLLNLLTPLIAGMMTPAEQQARANQTVDAKLNESLTGYKEAYDEEQRQLLAQQKRAQQFALAVNSMAPAQGQMAQDAYTQAAQQIQGLGTGLTGAVQAAQQGEANTAADRTAALTGSAGQVSGYDVPALTNAAQMSGVVVPATGIYGQAAGAYNAGLQRQQAAAGAVENISQGYGNQAAEAATKYFQQRTDLQKTRPDLYLKAVTALEDANRQDLATVITGLGLANTQANTASLINTRGLQTAINNYAAGIKGAATKANITNQKIKTGLETTKVTGVLKNGKAAPTYYFASPEAQAAHQASKIPTGWVVKPDDPYNPVPPTSISHINPDGSPATGYYYSSAAAEAQRVVSKIPTGWRPNPSDPYNPVPPTSVTHVLPNGEPQANYYFPSAAAEAQGVTAKLPTGYRLDPNDPYNPIPPVSVSHINDDGSPASGWYFPSAAMQAARQPAKLPSGYQINPKDPFNPIPPVSISHVLSDGSAAPGYYFASSQAEALGQPSKMPSGYKPNPDDPYNPIPPVSVSHVNDDGSPASGYYFPSAEFERARQPQKIPGGYRFNPDDPYNPIPPISISHINDDGSAAVGYFFVSPEAKGARQVSKIPLHFHVDPKDEFHLVRDPVAKKPSASTDHDATLIASATSKLGKVVMAPPYVRVIPPSARALILNPKARSTYKPLMGFKQAEASLLAAHFPKRLWKNKQAIAAVDEALLAIGYKR